MVSAWRSAELSILQRLKKCVPHVSLAIEEARYDVFLSPLSSREAEVGLLISAYLPNEDAVRLLTVAIDSARAQIGVSHSIWVVIGSSPEPSCQFDYSAFPDVNFVHSLDFPMAWEIQSIPDFLAAFLRLRPPHKGSTANGWGLDLGLRVMLESQRHLKYVMTLQMDIMFTQANTLRTLLDRFEPGVSCVGVREQLNYGKSGWILHSLGCVWDLEVLNEFGGSFLPDFPEFDVGEKAVYLAKQAGYTTVAFRNTMTTPTLRDEVGNYRRVPDVTVAESGEVIFLHLGRGIPKSKGENKGGISIEEWCALFAETSGGRNESC